MVDGVLSFLEPEGKSRMALFFGRMLPLWTVGFIGSAAIIGLAMRPKNRKAGRTLDFSTGRKEQNAVY